MDYTFDQPLFTRSSTSFNDRNHQQLNTFQTFEPGMCKQGTVRCLNRKCNGFAQILPLIPCENRPNCEIKRVQIRGGARSAEIYCPNCKGVSKRERKNFMDMLSKRKKRAEALKTKEQEGNINGAEYSASAEVEQHGESSRMAESRGAAGGGFIFEYPVLISEETNWDSQNDRHTGLVSGSDGTMVDTPTNEEYRATNSFAVVTYGPHVPSTPLREHQRPTTPMSASTETTGSFNDELDATQTFEYPSPDRDFSIGPYPIELRGLPTAPHSSPGPSNQTATNFDPLPRNPASSQFPVDRPSPPQIPIDPVLLEIDAERILRETGFWHETPKPSD